MPKSDEKYLCPSCGVDAVTVYDSRQVGQQRKRWRRCTACDYRWRTLEIDADLVMRHGYLAVEQIDAAIDALHAARDRVMRRDDETEPVGDA